jgi:multidrug efflux pump subunit AcrA (membrane-fusion protein)
VEGRTVTRTRIVMLVALLGVAGAGLTVLVAAQQPGDKAQTTGAGDRIALVCTGQVDTEDRMIGIYPDNYPQPSQVLKVLVNEGREVKKGDELLQLDTSMYDLKITEADAGIIAARAELAKAQAMIRAHSDALKVLQKELEAKEAELNAKKKELEETERAVGQGNKNKVELAIPQAAVLAAEKMLEAARMKLTTAQAEAPTYLEDLANAGIKRAEELKKQAEHAKRQVSCTAKADGTIIRTFVAEGSSFGPTTRDPAFWFVKKGPLLVRAEVTQEFASRVAEGQKAEIEDESAKPKDPKWTGRVTKVGDQFLPKRHGTGGALDIFPPSDDRVLECLVSIDLKPGETPPKFGQNVRVTVK